MARAGGHVLVNTDLTIIVPTRGRPGNVPKVLEAWRETGAFQQGAELVFVTDIDDPVLALYQQEIREAPEYGESLHYLIESEWRPLVPKLNRAAVSHAEVGRSFVGFAGDDHFPRTPGWAQEYLRVLRSGTSVVSCPDGLRQDELPTQWAMTSDIILALRRMVPAPVEHMYCDNSVADLARGAGIFHWLPDVMIEHAHPLAGKAKWDQGYRTVNDPQQYSADLTRYATWTYRGRRTDTAKILALKEATHGQ